MWSVSNLIPVRYTQYYKGGLSYLVLSCVFSLVHYIDYKQDHPGRLNIYTPLCEQYAVGWPT